MECVTRVEHSAVQHGIGASVKHAQKGIVIVRAGKLNIRCILMLRI